LADLARYLVSAIMFIYAQATAGTVIVGLFQQQLGDINLKPQKRGRVSRGTL